MQQLLGVAAFPCQAGASPFGRSDVLARWAAEAAGLGAQVSGGPVYVSDRPGKHDFELLKRVVLPDGSVLLAQQPGRPTADCLFTDVMRDGRSLLKVRSSSVKPAIHFAALSGISCA